MLFATVSTDSVNDTLLYYGDADNKGLHFALVPNLMDIGTMCGGSCVYDAVDPALSVQSLDNWLGWKVSFAVEWT